MSKEGGAAIDYAEVLRRIPHRFPFLMVDRAEDYQPNTSIVGIKNVTANEAYFQGHFPKDPVMPGVLIIEAMAQTGAVLMSKSLEIPVEGKSIYFLSVNEARFRAPVRPGDTLRLNVSVQRRRGDVFKFRGEAHVDGRLAAECEFAAMIVEHG
jgi:3-hydroxyacyl-[acyl-carrier-protein] dehydratase